MGVLKRCKFLLAHQLLFSRNRRLGHGKNDNMQEGRTLDECFNPFVQVNGSNWTPRPIGLRPCSFNPFIQVNSSNDMPYKNVLEMYYTGF